MRPDQVASANGDPPFALECERLRAKCRRQALLIVSLTDALSTLRQGARALKAENSDLWAENERIRVDRRALDRTYEVELVEVVLPLDARAPGAARIAVEECLREGVAAGMLENARVIVSELVTNSLLHSDGPADGRVVVSIELVSSSFRIAVVDSGSGAVIATRPPDLKTGGGFGLTLVQTLSERWGVERLTGGTRVWAQLSRSPRCVAGDRATGAAAPSIARVG
jgi:anti-sigma regulatory factor (Ser/Thr protein kinase)